MEGDTLKGPPNARTLVLRSFCAAFHSGMRMNNTVGMNNSMCHELRREKKRGYLYMSFSIILTWIAWSYLVKQWKPEENGQPYYLVLWDKVTGWLAVLSTQQNLLALETTIGHWTEANKITPREETATWQHLHFWLVGVTVHKEDTEEKRLGEWDGEKEKVRSGGGPRRTQRNLSVDAQGVSEVSVGGPGRACPACWERTG